MKLRRAAFAVLVLFLVVGVIGACARKGQRATPSGSSQPAAVASPGAGTFSLQIGVEYAMPGLALAFGELGISAVKFYPEAIGWDRMQPKAGSEIDFGFLDRMVTEYQDAGFTEIVLALRSRNRWASKDYDRNPTPKPEHVGAYEAWVRRTVERYDGDGTDDLPGLKRSIRYYEIGSEFSSYEPEPVADYLAMLEVAYRAAHNAFPDVLVAHAAFLTTTAFRDHPEPGDYEAAFARTEKRIMEHSLADIRRVLDRSDLFDVVNAHALGDPGEIVDIVRWFRFEMDRRGYAKPIIVSDTAMSPYIGWGSATTCTGPRGQLGIVVPPATEKDRCRIAAYFENLVAGDAATVRWAHAFAARDVIERVVIAAAEGVSLINTAFTEDLTLLKLPLARAGAGTAPWSGMVETKVKLGTEDRTVLGRRPAFFALRQLAGHLRGYTAIERVAVPEENVWAFKITRGDKPLWIAWLDPGVFLSGDEVPEATVTFAVTGSTATVETLTTEEGETIPRRESAPTKDGAVTVTVTPTPVFILP